MYTLYIKIEFPYITLSLQENEREVASCKWQDTNSLSQQLLFNIDSLLQQSKIGIGQLAEIKVVTDKSTYTSTRIAEAVAQTANYCLTRKK